MKISTSVLNQLKKIAPVWNPLDIRHEMTTCRQILNFVDFIFFSESKCPIKKVNQWSRE